MHQKAYAQFELKDIDDNARTFSGLASTWDLDLEGDVMEKGAFSRSLKHWRGSSGKRLIPLIDQHKYDSVRRVFGKLIEANETDAGLDAKFSVVASAEGDEYLARIKGGYLNGLSVGFETVRAEKAKALVQGREREVRRIKEVKLMEISAVIWGMNPDALIDVAVMKALIRSAKERPLSDDEVSELKALQVEVGEILTSNEPQIAPDDPARMEIEALLRSVRLRGLAEA